VVAEESEEAVFPSRFSGDGCTRDKRTECGKDDEGEQRASFLKGWIFGEQTEIIRIFCDLLVYDAEYYSASAGESGGLD